VYTPDETYGLTAGSVDAGHVAIWYLETGILEALVVCPNLLLDGQESVVKSFGFDADLFPVKVDTVKSWSVQLCMSYRVLKTPWAARVAVQATCNSLGVGVGTESCPPTNLALTRRQLVTGLR
jgi:hypothetical protein